MQRRPSSYTRRSNIDTCELNWEFIYGISDILSSGLPNTIKLVLLLTLPLISSWQVYTRQNSDTTPVYYMWNFTHKPSHIHRRENCWCGQLCCYDHFHMSCQEQQDPSEILKIKVSMENTRLDAHGDGWAVMPGPPLNTSKQMLLNLNWISNKGCLLFLQNLIHDQTSYSLFAL